MNEALITKIEELKHVLTLILSDLRAFAIQTGLRRKTALKSSESFPKNPALPTHKVPNFAQLTAYMINFHLLHHNILFLNEKNNELFIQVREGKTEEAIQLLNSMPSTWKLLRNWSVVKEEDQHYLQCEGVDYLPQLLAVHTNTPVKKLSETLTFKTVKENQVICQRVLNRDPNYLPDAATLLTQTRTRVAINSDYLKPLENYLDNLLLESPPALTSHVAALNKFIFLCFKTSKTMKDAFKLITTFYKRIAEKHPDVDRFLNEQDYMDVISTFCKPRALAETLNSLAETPLTAVDINVKILAPIAPVIKALTLKLSENKTSSPGTFKNIAAELKSLVTFFLNTTVSDQTKIELAKVLTAQVMPPCNQLLDAIHINTSIRFDDEDKIFEQALLTDLELAKQLYQHTKMEELKREAISCQFSVLTVLMKYYRHQSQWTALEKTSEHYFRILKVAPDDMLGGQNKDFLKLCVQTEIATVQGKCDDALSQYKALCKYNDAFYIATLGENLITAFSQSKTANYGHALFFMKELFSLEPLENNNTPEVLAFKSCCENLEREHLAKLDSCIQAHREHALEFTSNGLTISPENKDDLIYFKAAIKKQRIKVTCTENSLTLTQPLKVTDNALRAVFSATRKLKEDAVKKARAAEELCDLMIASRVEIENNPHAFFVDPTVKIGFQPKAKNPRTAVLMGTVAVQKKPAVLREPLRIDFGDYGIYDERDGDNQKIIALQGDHHPFGCFFGFIACADADKKYDAVLKRGQIVGPKGEEGVKFFKTVKRGKTCKLKVMDEEFLTGQEVTCVGRHHLLCFDKEQDHKNEQREQKTAGMRLTPPPSHVE